MFLGNIKFVIVFFGNKLFFLKNVFLIEVRVGQNRKFNIDYWYPE